MPTASNALAVVEEPKAITVIRQALEDRSQALIEVLPPGMDARRFKRVALLAISKNPALLACSPGSIVASIVEAAEVGLEPTGGIGGAHLVPFKQKQGPSKAQLILDYRGTLHLVRMGGGGEVKAVLVYEGDDFTVYEGSHPSILHLPKYETVDPTKITYVYAYPIDNPEKFEVMTKAQIDAIRARSKAANAGPWVSDYGQMARKTVIKRLANYLGLKPQVRALIEADTEREFGGETPQSVQLPSRSRSLHERIKAQRQPAEEPPDEPEKAPDAGDESSNTLPDPSTEPQTCANVAGDETVAQGETCGLEAGHQGPHKNAESTASWPRREDK